MLTEFTTECVQRVIKYLYTGRVELSAQNSDVLELDKLFSLWELQDSIPNDISEKLIKLLQPEPHGPIQVAQQVTLTPHHLMPSVISQVVQGPRTGTSAHLGDCPQHVTSKEEKTPHVHIETTPVPNGVRLLSLRPGPLDGNAYTHLHSTGGDKVLLNAQVCNINNNRALYPQKLYSVYR